MPSSSSGSSKNPSLSFLSRANGQQQARRRGFLRCSSAAPSSPRVRHRSFLSMLYLRSASNHLLIIVAEPPELSRLKCAGHHHKGNTSSKALQTEQFLVCRVTSRYNHRFSDRTSIHRTKASPEILQPQVLHHRHKSYYKLVLKHYYKYKL